MKWKKIARNLLEDLIVGAVSHLLLGAHAIDDLSLGDRTDVELAAADDPVDTGEEEDGGKEDNGVVHLVRVLVTDPRGYDVVDLQCLE